MLYLAKSKLKFIFFLITTNLTEIGRIEFTFSFYIYSYKTLLGLMNQFDDSLI
jgi:hypothetical protein